MGVLDKFKEQINKLTQVCKKQIDGLVKFYKKSKQNRIKVIAISAFILIVIWAFIYMFRTTQAENVKYQHTQAYVTNIENKVVATGSVKPREVIEIKPNISGVVSKINVLEGSTVNQGDTIASLQVIPDVNKLNAARQSINSARITLNNEAQNYRRAKSLYSQGVMSKSDFDNATANYRLAQQNVSAAESDYQIAVTGIAPGLEKYATVQIRATISGMILSIPVEVGNTVQELNNFSVGTTIATMADVKQMIFEGKIDEADVGKLKEGMPVQITIGALPNEVFDAKLEFISPSGTEENGIVQFNIKANILSGEGSFLRANYSANAEIIVDNRKDVLALNSAHIRYDELSQPYVEVVKKGTEKSRRPVYEKRKIELGASNGIDVEIKRGLMKDEFIKVWNTDLERK